MTVADCIVSPASVSFHAGTAHFAALGKWRAFYSLLILADGSPVDREQVCRLKGWSDDPLTTGREVARHLKSVKLSRLSVPPVLSDRPTVSWALNPTYRLHSEPANFRLVATPLLKSAEDNPLAVGRYPLDTLLPFALRAAGATLAFYRGELDHCRRIAAEALRVAPCPEATAIALVWQLRALHRLAHGDDGLEAIELGEQSLRTLPDLPLIRALRQRYEAQTTLHAPTEEWPQRADRLCRAADAPHQAIDVSALAYCSNYAAVTLRRMGQLEEAANRIGAALLCACASGDVYLLQVALFNAGLILSEQACDEPRAALAIEALRLVSTISSQHRIGNDSAQNEILIAELHMARMDWPQARVSLDQARRLADVSGNHADAAELALCEARLLMAENGRNAAKAAAHLLQQAEEMFLQLGRDDRVQAARRERLAHSGKARATAG